MKRSLIALLFAVVSTTTFQVHADVAPKARPPAEDDDAQAKELAAVQGRWARTMETEGGKIKVYKEHIGNKSIVTFMDSDGNVVGAKRSEFRLETTGDVRIFTFFNNVVTAGPQQGQIDAQPHSYIYRVVGDTFVEVNGMLIGDNRAPSAYTWTRVKE